MAKLTRFTMPVFAGNAAQTQTSVFGTMKTSPQYTSDVAASIGTTAYGNGWADAIEIGYAPYMEDMNTLQKAITYQISYGQQQGIPEWARDTEYYKGSLAKLNTANGSQIYSSLVDNNVGNLLSDATKWKLVLDTANTYVTTNTAQTITGAKTFTSNVKVSKSSPFVDLYNTNITKGTAPSSLQVGRNAMLDKDGKFIAMTQYQYLTDGRIEAILRAYNPNSETSYTQIGIAYKADGTVFTNCPTPTDTTTTSGTQIATTGWVNSVGNNLVHRSGDEEIGGTKTFKASPAVNISQPKFRLQSSTITKGTKPASDTELGWYNFEDNAGRTMGRLRYYYNQDKSSVIQMTAFQANSSGDSNSASIRVVYPASGGAYATAPASDAANSIVTTVAKNWDSTNKKGYYQLGNGLIIQWGFLDTSGTVTLRFPKAFTTTNYTVVGVSYSSTIFVVDKNSKTTSTVSVGVGNTTGFNWIAIGY